MLAIIGLGLGSERDISLRGLDAARSSDVVYLEKYTSAFFSPPDAIEGLVGKKVRIAYRDSIEAEGDADPAILEEAREKRVALLVVGTPLFATTHAELVIRAKELQIEVELIHNASIQSVLGCCGFSSYSFGRTVSIPFFTDLWRPMEFYEGIAANLQSGLHTLCLLDIKIREPTIGTLMGKERAFFDRFMTINEALLQIKEAMAAKGRRELEAVRVVGVERFGSPTEKFHYGTIDDLLLVEYGGPLHSLIVPAFTSPASNRMECEQVQRYFSAN